jgi:transposase
VFVPQMYEPGWEAEVDWGEAVVEIAGQRLEVGLFFMRACYSGARFVLAFERQTRQAFLEAHLDAFDFFGGVFYTIRYDKRRSAVKQVLRGRRRVEQDRFVALRSRYLFESAFRPRRPCRAREKGGVEGVVGRFRRAHLVPVPTVGAPPNSSSR